MPKPSYYYAFVKEITPLAEELKKYQQFFCSPVFSLEDKQRVLSYVLQSASPEIKNFLYVLLVRGDFFLLESIVSGLLKKEMEMKNLLEATIETTVKLTTTIRQSFVQKLEQYFNKTIQLTEKINPLLIGGFRLSVGGMVFDDSLLFHLKQISKQGVG